VNDDSVAQQLARGIDLRTILRELGVEPEELARAEETGTIELLALERIIDGSGERYELDEVAAESLIPTEHILELWRALGFPEPRPGEKVFNDRDLEMLADTVPLLAEGGLDAELALQMTRVIGSSIARIATSQVDAIATAAALIRDGGLDGDGDDDESSPREPAPVRAEDDVARHAAELLPMMPKVLEFVWRRHLANAARRRMVRMTGDEVAMCVGFADLVGFTAQTQQLPEHDLAEVVGRFDRTAHEVVAGLGGRVIKMIGDEVMFIADDIATGAHISLALAETYRNDDAFSDVRVGLAAGDVLERDGDVYGPVVNLASRIVSVAYPGSVVVSVEVADALVDDDALVVKSIRSHYLKDIGKVKLFSLRRPQTVEEEARYRRARAQRAARREFLVERRADRHREVAELREALPRALGEDVPLHLLDDADFVDEPTDQIDAITDAVLEADLDPDLQVALLTDIAAARAFEDIEREASHRADEVDAEAERRMDEADAEAKRRILEAEREKRRRIEEAERDASRKIEQARQDAADASTRINEDASRRIKQVAEETERKASTAAKDAERSARRKAKDKAKEKSRRKPD